MGAEQLERTQRSDEQNRKDSATTSAGPHHNAPMVRLRELVQRAELSGLPGNPSPSTRARRAGIAPTNAVAPATEGPRVQRMAKPAETLIQRRLMPYAEFKRGKAAAVDEKRGLLGLKDVSAIYLRLRSALIFKRWDSALAALDDFSRKLQSMRAKDYWNSADERDAFLDAVGRTIEEEQTWIRAQTAPDPLLPDTPQQLGTDTAGVIPLAARRVVTLTMSQGVAADLRQLSFYSNDFSSCSPIAMYNAATHRGGLFHFPGSGLSGSDREDTARRLGQMYRDVTPSQVWVNSRGFLVAEGLPRMPNDIGPITDFLRDEVGYEGPVTEVVTKAGEFSLYFDDANDQPVFVAGSIPGVHGGGISAMQDRTRDERGALAGQWSTLPAATKFGIDQYSHLGTNGSY